MDIFILINIKTSFGKSIFHTVRVTLQLYLKQQINKIRKKFLRVLLKKIETQHNLKYIFCTKVICKEDNFRETALIIFTTL